MYSMAGTHIANCDTDRDSARRETYRIFYNQLLNDCGRVDLVKVESSLHDAWSEIRKDSAKSLSKLEEKLPVEVLYIIVEGFLHKNDGKSWQVLHGSLLGITALWKAIHRHFPSQLTSVREMCVKLLSHNRLPVREAARSCIHVILEDTVAGDESTGLSWNCFYSSQVESANRMVLSDVSSESEDRAVELDGVLGCVGDVVPQLRFVNPAHSLVALEREPLLDMLHLCLGHPASTVRQRASAILISLCSPLGQVADPEVCVDISTVRYVVSKVTDTLSAESMSSWWHMEGALLVAEGVIACYVVICAQKEISCYYTALLPLVSILLEDMTRLLRHGAFEIRRSFSQVVPSLARIWMLISLSDDDSIRLMLRDVADLNFFLGAMGIARMQELSGTYSDSEALPPPPQSIRPQFPEGKDEYEDSLMWGARIYCAWIAELLKCAFMLLDAWGDDLGADGETGGYPWALQLPRRFGEAEKQQLFLNSLVASRRNGNCKVARSVAAWISQCVASIGSGLIYCGQYLISARKMASFDFIVAGALLSGLPRRQLTVIHSPMWVYSLAYLLYTAENIDPSGVETVGILLYTQFRVVGVSGVPLCAAEGSVCDPASHVPGHSQVRSLLLELSEVLLPVIMNTNYLRSQHLKYENVEEMKNIVLDSILLEILRILLLTEFTSKLSVWNSHFMGGLLVWVDLLLSPMCEDRPRYTSVLDDVCYAGLISLMQCAWRGVQSVIVLESSSDTEKSRSAGNCTILKNILRLFYGIVTVLLMESRLSYEWTSIVDTARRYARLVLSNEAATIAKLESTENLPNFGMGEVDGHDDEEFSDWDDDSDHEVVLRSSDTVEVDASQIREEVLKLCSTLEDMMGVVPVESKHISKVG